MKKWKLAIIMGMGGVFLHTAPSWAFPKLIAQGEVLPADQRLQGRIASEGETKTPIGFSLARTNVQEWTMSVILDHYQILDWDVSTQIEGIWTPAVSSEQNITTGWNGQVRSRYSLVDLQPFDEMTGSMRYQDRVLSVTRLSWGRTSVRGWVKLIPPFALDLTFELNGVDLNDFLEFFAREKTYEAGGPVTGTIQLSGDLTRLHVRGSLKCVSGFVKTRSFDRIYLNLAGWYPLLEVTNSELYDQNGMSFSISGLFDLSAAGRYKQQIEQLTYTPIVSSLRNRAEWTLKEREISEDRSSRTLKYMLFEDAGYTGNQGSESAVIGVEQKLKF